MSGAAFAWALKQPIPMSAAKFVLCIMADQATTDLAFLAVDTIAKHTSLNRKTVMASIDRLVQWNLIEDTGERRGRTGQIPVYRLLMKEGLFDNEYHSKRPKNGTGTKNGTVPKPAANGTNFGAEASQKRDTDLNDLSDPSLSDARVTECAKAIIAAGFPAMRMNQSHPKLIAAAAACTPRELADVVTEYIRRGTGPPNLAYVCTTALNRRREAHANPSQASRNDRPAGRQSAADQAAERAERIFAGT